MSLAIALAGADALVLAADSRVTEGYTLSGPRTRDDSIKFVQLNDAWGALTYGIAEIGHAGLLALKDALARETGSFGSIGSMLDRGRDLLDRASTEWGRSNPAVARRAKDVGFILGGYDQETDAFRTFSLQSPEFAATSPPSGCLVAGQWHIAKYFLAALYARNMDVAALKRLAALLLSVTMAVDPQVGGSMRMATVTRGMAFQWVSDDENESLNRECQLFDGLFREGCRSVLSRIVNENPWMNKVGDIESAG